MLRFSVAVLLCATFLPIFSLAEECNAPKRRCEDGNNWHSFNGTCYYWSNRTKGWFGAEKHCQGMGGHLVSIESSSKQEFLHAFAECSKEFWMGLVKTDVRNMGFVWWETNKPSDYGLQKKMSNFSLGHYLDCVYFDKKGQWINNHCEQITNFVCTKPALPDELPHGLTHTNEPPANRECPKNWKSIENNCYFVSFGRTNYFNAQLSCEAMGATVASAHSRHEHFLINMALKCQTEAWIGLEKVRPCTTNSSQAACWVWMDGSSYDFTAWHSDFPSNKTEVECAITNGRWKSTNCYNEHPYICKKKK